MPVSMIRGAALAFALMVLAGLGACGSQDADARFAAIEAFRMEKDRADAAREAADERCRQLPSAERAACMGEADAEFKRHMAKAQVELDRATR